MNKFKFKNGEKVIIDHPRGKFDGKIGRVGFISKDFLNGGFKCEVNLIDGPDLVVNEKFLIRY